MRKPDFFIVGAPKCGTTAMYSYLRMHPEIFMPAVKEPYYFGSDLLYRSPRPSRAEYLRLFEPGRTAKRAGEASPCYLYSRKAASEIRDFSPGCRIIIMLRNPVDMIYSHYLQLVKTGDETIRDLEAALEAEARRKRGLGIPKRCALVDWLFYRDLVKFTDQVERYFDVFGRDAVQVIIFDDFHSDTQRVFRSGLRFLGVTDASRPDSFEVVNPAAEVRSVWVRDVLRNTTVQSIVRTLMPTRWIRKRIAEKLLRLNERPMTKIPMDPALRRRLEVELTPEIERLSSLLGRDLTHWSRGEHGDGRREWSTASERSAASRNRS